MTHKIVAALFTMISLYASQITTAMEATSSTLPISADQQAELNFILYHNLSYPLKMELALDPGAQVNAQFHPSKETTLHAAARDCILPCIKTLVSRGAYLDATDVCLKTPLFYAAEYGKSEAVQLLIELGANPSYLNDVGETPIDYITLHPKKVANKLVWLSPVHIKWIEDTTRKALLTTVSPFEMQQVPLKILYLTKCEIILPKEIGYHIGRFLVPLIVSEKLAIAQEYLPEIPKNELKAILFASARKAFRSPMPAALPMPVLEVTPELSEVATDSQRQNAHLCEPPLYPAVRVFLQIDNNKPVMELLNSEIDINAQNEVGDTLLHEVVQSAKYYRNICLSIPLLIETCASIHTKNKEGQTPLDVTHTEEKTLYECTRQDILKALITAISPDDIKSVIPEIIKLKRGNQYYKDAGILIAKLIAHVIDERIELGRVYVPDIKTEDLCAEMISSINRLIRKSPDIKAAELAMKNANLQEK